jgi:hypothetical protein
MQHSLWVLEWSVLWRITCYLGSNDGYLRMRMTRGVLSCVAWIINTLCGKRAVQGISYPHTMGMIGLVQILKLLYLTV